MARLHYKGNDFIYDGKPVRILSGGMHYFRIVPEYWTDRLKKLKACGLNTVETYIPWNFHEPKPGQFRFDGMANVERYIQLAGELGLFVIVRPSPYICAEWEFGGLPSWLLAEPDTRLRCADEKFLKRVDAYYDELMPRLVPLLCTNGGPIVAMQIENEYGSYGNDAGYLRYLRQAMIDRDIDVLLFTSDGPTDAMLQAGRVQGALATVNFGSRSKGAFDKLREYQPEAPVMCMEFWNGWFNHWGEKHHTRDASDVAEVLEEILEEKASVNFYMFHGGTNFGFYNGANCQLKDHYEPTVTSYDYDALLNESGEPTDKFYAVQEMISKYMNIDRIALPKPIEKKDYGCVSLSQQASLLSQLDPISSAVRRTNPEPMEKLGQDYGFIMYSTILSGPREKQDLVIEEVRDRAHVFVDGAFVGITERGKDGREISFAVPPEGVEISILVENMGRINYGPYLNDNKGITKHVRHGFQILHDWTIRPLPLTDLSGLKFKENGRQFTDCPTFYRGIFHADELKDTFLNLEGWTKGVALLNGFNLGRYWNKGPQRTLYVPAPMLKYGENELIVFELHGTVDPVVNFVGVGELGNNLER